jgi:hypothetical protein
MVVRASILGALLDKYGPGSERDQTQFDPRQVFEALSSRDWPTYINDALTSYGHTNCDVFNMLKFASEYQRAMMTVAQDQDLYTLGMTLVRYRHYIPSS